MKSTYLLVIIVLVELFLISQFSSRIVSILRTDSRIQTIQAQRNVLKQELTTKIDTLNYIRTDYYVEEIAQQKLHYGRDQENLYIIPHKDTLPNLAKIELEEHSKTVWLGEAGNWFRLFYN